MSRSEKGFSTIDVIVALSIASLIALGATMTIFQVINGTGRNNEHMTVFHQVQNAGYWISRDAQMAENIITDNLSSTEFIVLTWTEWDYDSDETYHSITYFFEGLSGGTGKLKRNHWSSTGTDIDTLIAEYISYDPNDPVNTSNASYQNPALNVKLAALYGDASETREYQINRRPTF